MKNIFKTIFILLLFCSFVLVACDSDEEDDQPSNGGDVTPPSTEITYDISLDYQFLDLEVGEEKILIATLLANGKKSKDTITWSTSNENVASVTDGKITAKGNGEAVITASAHNVSATAKVTVTTPEPFLVLSATFIEVKMGKTAQLDAWLTVGEAQNISYSSNNNTVVTVSNTGLITALAEGEAVITATTGDGLTATCKVNVVVDYELIFPEIENKDVFIGDVIDLNTVVQINGAGTDEIVEILGSGFTVNGNIITIVDDGPITITAKYKNDAFSQTINSWIKISTTEEFLNIKNNLGGHYMLVNDLYFEGAKVKAFTSWNTWNANNEVVFKGVFDGQNHTIKNLQPIPESGNDASIFGYMASGSIVRNVNFIGVIGEGRFSVVASWCHGLIENVYVDMKYISTSVAAAVATDNNPIGTLVAKVQNNATIRNCVVNLTLVEGADIDYFGALASRVYKGAEITNCFVLCNQSLPLAHVGSENIDASTKLVTSLEDLNTLIQESNSYDSSWTILEGQYPYLGTIDSSIIVEENQVNAFAGISIHFSAISDFDLTYSLVENVDGVALTSDGLLTVNETVENGTTFEVLITNLYGGRTIINVVVKTTNIKVTGGENIIIDDFILGVTKDTIEHNVEVKEDNISIVTGISYVSSNESVATVDNTKVVIVGEGTAKISVLYDGVEIHSFTVTINTIWQPVTTVEEFLAIGNNKTTMSYNYLLMNNLDFKGATITEFSSWDTWNADNSDVFSGKFDGQGYTISNFQPLAKNGTNNPSIFGYMSEGSIVRNVNFMGVIGEERFSLVSSYCLGIIENVYAEITYISTNPSKPNANNPAGTLVGKVQSKAVISNCVVVLTLVPGAQTEYLGAFAGRVYAGAQIKNCYVLCEQSLPVVSNGGTNIDASSKVFTTLEELNSAIKNDYTFGSDWTVTDGCYPYVGTMNSNISLDDLYAYIGISTQLNANSNFPVTYSLVNAIDGVSITKDGVLTVESTVLKDTIVQVLISNNYGGQLIAELTTKDLTVDVTSIDSIVVEECILGEDECTIAHEINVTQNGEIVTEGVLYVSSNTSVATIDSTNVVIVGEGTTTISVLYNGVEVHTFIVTVNNVWRLVSTVEEFLAIANNKTTMSYKYRLINNLDFEGATITEFSSWDTWNADNTDIFSGVFDGQGYTISNFKPIAKNGTNNPSIFGYMGEGSIVKNVNFIGVIGEERFSLVSSYCLGIIENVYAEIEYISTNPSKPNANNPAGTLVGKVQNKAVITNCVVVLTLIPDAETTYLGAFAGRVYAGAQIKNCYVLCEESLPLASNGNTNVDASSKVFNTLSDLNDAIESDSTFGLNWVITEGENPKVINPNN